MNGRVKIAMRIDEGHHHFGRRSSSAYAKKSRRLAKDLVRPPQLTDLAFQVFELYPLNPAKAAQRRSAGWILVPERDADASVTAAQVT